MSPGTGRGCAGPCAGAAWLRDLRSRRSPGQEQAAEGRNNGADVLPLVGLDLPNHGNELGMGCRVDGAMLHLRARRVIAEIPWRLGGRRRPDRSRGEAASAARANVLHDFVHALSAERAFETADHRIRRIGRKGLAAMLTSRSELEHDRSRIRAAPFSLNGIVDSEARLSPPSRAAPLVAECAHDEAAREVVYRSGPASVVAGGAPCDLRPPAAANANVVAARATRRDTLTR
jgi:hypothetical protein